MIRSNGEIQNAIRYIRDAIKAGNDKAVTDLPSQVLDLLDTLYQGPDLLSAQPTNGRIKQLEDDNRYLNDQIRIMITNHNMTQDTLRKMGEELDKFHKIFGFLVEQKKAKEELDGDTTR